VGQQIGNSGELDQRLDALAQSIGSHLQRGDRIAISDFPDLRGKPSDLGKHISEELTTRIMNQGQAHVVERGRMQQVMKEQSLGASEMVDDDTAAHVGKLLGAGIISVGTISDLGTQVKINARLIDTSSGEVIGATSIALSRVGPVARLLDGTILAAPDERSAVPMVFIRKAPSGAQTPLVVRNLSGYCLRLKVGAEELRIFDRDREVRCIAANDKAFVTVRGYGEYALTALGSMYDAPFEVVARYERVFYFSKDKKQLDLKLQDFHGIR
jgi:TolB-like protein